MTTEFKNFYSWAATYLGLNLAAYKQTQLQRRILTVMSQTGSTSLREFSIDIEKNESTRQRFLDYITINVTDFFRNPDLFAEFETILVNELVPSFGEVKIWSAACSIGSEPYSLAMIAHDRKVSLQGKILATDIDEKILERAKEAIYKPYEMKNVEPTMMMRHFKEENKEYHLSSVIKEKVAFKQHDLLMDPFEKNFHAIICRNVIIYFNKEMKEELYQKFSESLVSGGVIFTGATETIYKPEQYNLEKIGKFLYQKK